MKDYNQEQLEAHRPKEDASHLIQFCLNQLYLDNEKVIDDEVVTGLTFEELIGALLKGKDNL